MKFVCVLIGATVLVTILRQGQELRSLNADEIADSIDAISSANESDADCVRTKRGGLLAYYDFSLVEGPIIRDRSGVGLPVDLQIENMEAVRRNEGELEVLTETLIQSVDPATKISDSVRRSGEFSIEAWIRPSNVEQKGPARIVTLSRDSSIRNFTLGQDGNQFDIRFRTSKTNANGYPSLESKSKSLTTKLTHVVYTRDRSGVARVFVNGEQSNEAKITGSTMDWKDSFRLALANEQTKNRVWLGTYYLVAIYGRDLSVQEIELNFRWGLQSEVFQNNSLPRRMKRQDILKRKLRPY